MPYRALTRLIDTRFEALSPELQRAARWVREHPAELGLQSMRASARSAGVAPATMSRLAQALGLEGFEAMRRPVIEAMVQQAGQAPAEPDSSDAMALALRRNTDSVFARNKPQVVDAAASAILAARQVFFLGLRASFGIAYHLRYACNWLRPDTHLVADLAGALDDPLAHLQTSDLLVCISQAPYTRRTVELSRRAKAAGTPILALTDSPLSPLARGARHVLLFDAASPSYFHSMTGAQALAERLALAVANRGGAAVIERLRTMHEHLQHSGAYFEKRIHREPHT